MIARGEGLTSEFKRSMPSDLGRELCAFANASGGVILLGVTDKGEIVGVADHKQGEIPNPVHRAFRRTAAQGQGGVH